MNEEKNTLISADKIRAEYTLLKKELPNNSIIVCDHLGFFTQDVLVSTIASLEASFSKNEPPKSYNKRLTYLVIECIQNIIFHSDDLPKEYQIAYILVAKNKNAYTISSSNALHTKNIDALEKKLERFLSLRTEILSELIQKRIQNPEINKNGHGGLGLLTMVNKSGKGFEYKISKILKNYALFHIRLKLNFKNYDMENINLAATKDSPQIMFDNESKTLKITGNSYPEDCDKIYDPVKEFLSNFKIEEHKKLDLHFHFNLINSTSTVYLAQLIVIAVGLNKKGLSVHIKWYYDEYDEEMLDLGEKLSSISKLSIEYIPVEDKD